jgi:hypothetical protein
VVIGKKHDDVWGRSIRRRTSHDEQEQTRANDQTAQRMGHLNVLRGAVENARQGIAFVA